MEKYFYFGCMSAFESSLLSIMCSGKLSVHYYPKMRGVLFNPPCYKNHHFIFLKMRLGNLVDYFLFIT